MQLTDIEPPSAEALAQARRWMGSLPRDQMDLLLVLTDDAHRVATLRAKAAQPIKVQVVVQGGLVVNVGANVPLEVEVIDLDNDACGFEASSDFDENGVVEDGSWWVCSVESWPVEQVGMLYQVRDREGADD